jgi:hypothetical protein
MSLLELQGLDADADDRGANPVPSELSVALCGSPILPDGVARGAAG